MKKTLLATAILSGLVSVTAGAATVYKDDASKVDLKGRVYAGYVSQENGDDAVSNGESDAYFRLGFKAKSKLTDSLTAVARTEFQFEQDDNDKQQRVRTRLAFAGVKGDFGQVTFGRSYTSQELIADWTDTGVSNVPGNDAINAFSREANILNYSIEVSGVDLAAHFQLPHASNADKYDEKSGFGLAAAYGFDFGLTLGASLGGESKDDADTTTTLLGAKYKIGNLKASLVYDLTDADGTDVNALETSLAYKMNKVTLVGRYLMQDVDGADDASVEQLTLGVAYKFNSNFRVVAEYVADQVEDAENITTFAARYDF